MRIKFLLSILALVAFLVVPVSAQCGGGCGGHKKIGVKIVKASGGCGGGCHQATQQGCGGGSCHGQQKSCCSSGGSSCGQKKSCCSSGGSSCGSRKNSCGGGGGSCHTNRKSCCSSGGSSCGSRKGSCGCGGSGNQMPKIIVIVIGANGQPTCMPMDMTKLHQMLGGAFGMGGKGGCCSSKGMAKKGSCGCGGKATAKKSGCGCGSKGQAKSGCGCGSKGQAKSGCGCGSKGQAKKGGCGSKGQAKKSGCGGCGSKSTAIQMVPSNLRKMLNGAIKIDGKVLQLKGKAGAPMMIIRKTETKGGKVTPKKKGCGGCGSKKGQPGKAKKGGCGGCGSKKEKAEDLRVIPVKRGG